MMQFFSFLRDPFLHPANAVTLVRPLKLWLRGRPSRVTLVIGFFPTSRIAGVTGIRARRCRHPHA
jgi:hypothetical protein